MPSHFSTIGMPVTCEEDLFQLAREAYDLIPDTTLPVETPHGVIFPWKGRDGEEMHLFFDLESNPIGIAPHFRGKSSRTVNLTNLLTREGDLPIESAWHGWANPSAEKDYQGDYPFVFDGPDGRGYEHLPLPCVRKIQLAAFAHKFEIFDSPGEFEARPNDEWNLASESFIPLGLFGEGPPRSHGLFFGKVLETAVLRSTLRNKPFHWALVDTLGGQVDVVADPELITRSIKPGGIVGGSFWLSGILLPG